MARIVLPHANGFYQSDSLPISNQQCVNWHVNIPQAPSLSERTLFGTPGLSVLATAGTDSNRGGHTVNGIPYFVNGTTLYRLDKASLSGVETFSVTSLGTIAGSSRVSMADNGTQLCILVPRGAGYIFDTSTTTLSTITDVDFIANGNPLHVEFVDSYFLFTTDTKKFIISSSNNGTAYNALDFGTAEADPDSIVAPVVHQNQLYILGSETTEGFQNVGGSDFPFQRNGIFLDKGCYAQHSLVNANNSFLFVGGGKNEEPAVWMFAGSSYQKASTTAIDNLLSALTQDELVSIFAYSYSQKSADFVAFVLPSTTLVLDTSSGLWHERQSRATDANGLFYQTRNRVNSVVRAYNRVIVGDAQSGTIGEMDSDVYTEYGEPLIRTVTTQPFSDMGRSFGVSRIEATFESGVGNSDVVDPVIRMSTSRRRGKTFHR